MPISRLSIALAQPVGLILALVWTLLVAGAQIAQAQQGFVFDRIVVDGNQRIEADTVLSLADLPRGQPVSAGEVNAALQRVIASDFFEDVLFEPRGNTLVIRLQERPTINVINIEGNQRIDDEPLLAEIGSRPRQVFVPTQAEEDARIIAAVYEAAGRFNATVTPVIIRRSDNRVDLVFEVIEGDVVEIERISFVGNEVYSDSRLRRVLATKQAGLFRSLVQRDTFVEGRIELDVQLLREFYNARGYLDFTVLDVTSEFSRERDATFVTFTLREGQQFDLGEISLSSTVPEVDPAAYGDVLRIRSGQTYSSTNIQTTVDRLERRITDNQLDFVRVNPVITRNNEDLTVDVEFQFVRAPRVFVERINISGNTTTVDRVIRNQFRVVEGDPFNPTEIQRATNRIRALGFFESASVDTRQGSGPDQVIVDVDVVEQPTGSLSFGATYSVDSGVGVQFGFAERNFLGRGQTLSFDIEVGTQNQNSQITFVEPFFLGRDLRFRFEAFFRETEFDNVDYNTENIGLQPSLTFPLAENSRLTVGYNLSQQDIFGIDPGTSPIIQAEEGARLTSAVNYEYVFDTRRTGLDPTAGVLFSFGQEFAGLGGDNKYIRTSVRAVAQREVFSEEVTLRARAEGGNLYFLEGDSRVIDRFATSSSRLRGFASRGIGPRDLDAANQDVLGGNYYAVVGLEAEFPLGLPEEYGISGGVFWNAGSVWGLDNTDGAGGPGSVDDDFELRSAIGFTIFWTTPLGPLRLDFSRAIDANPFDEEQNFNLSVSTNF